MRLVRSIQQMHLSLVPSGLKGGFFGGIRNIEMSFHQLVATKAFSTVSKTNNPKIRLSSQALVFLIQTSSMSYKNKIPFLQPLLPEGN